MVTTTVYYHAVYVIAAAIYGSYVASLILRARRARARLDAIPRS